MKCFIPFSKRALLTFLVAFAISPTQAALLLDVPGDSSAFQRGSFTNFGYAFTVSESVVVDALGLWDFGADGLVDAHPVGLWDDLGNLLAQAIVDSNSTAVASANAANDWLFTTITTLVLTPGQYKLGAYYPSSADLFIATLGTTPAQINVNPLAVYLGSYYASGTESLTEPNSVGDAAWNPGFFGPNAQLRPLPVPEPSSLALAGIAVVSLGLARRRRAVKLPWGN